MLSLVVSGLGVLVGGKLHQIQYTVFAVFDGHAGAGCAVTASNDLWAAVQSRLESVATQLVGEEGSTKWFTRTISKESLVIGALESAFWDTDQQIGDEKKIYHMAGGCTVLMAVFILGKLYVANAGDCRCVLWRASADDGAAAGELVALSEEHVAEAPSERPTLSPRAPSRSTSRPPRRRRPGGS